MNISVSRNGVEIGEWTEEEVQTLLDEGKLLPTDYYWMQGMTEWQEIATSIKSPPPAKSVSDANEQPRIGINRLTYIGIIVGWWIVAAFLYAFTPNADGLVTLIGIPLFLVCTFLRLKNIGYNPYYVFLLFLPVVNVFILLFCLFQAPNSVTKIRINPYLLWFLIISTALCVPIITLLIYLLTPDAKHKQPDSVTQSLINESAIMNRTLPQMLNSKIRMDSTSVSENHTIHCHFTVMDATLDADQIKAFVMPTIKDGFLANSDAQKLQSDGVTFEYDYYKQDGTPITQILVSPNDFK